MFKTLKALKTFLERYESLDSFNNSILELSKNIDDIKIKTESIGKNLELNSENSRILNQKILDLEKKINSLDGLESQVSTYQNTVNQLLLNKKNLEEDLLELEDIKTSNETLKQNLESDKTQIFKDIEFIKDEHILIKKDMEKIEVKGKELNLNIQNLLENLNDFLD